MITEFFAKAYPADTPRVEVDEAFHDEVARGWPAQLHDLVGDVGLGKHRSGLLELIDPRTYLPPYQEFFGGDSAGRVPFLVNAFGEPIAYKRVGPREVEISILHTYGPKLDVLAYDLGDFFDRVLGTDDGLREVVNVSLFNQLRSRLRTLRPGQSYGFDPGILAEEPEGTKADASYFEVVDTVEHLGLLLRRAGE